MPMFRKKPVTVEARQVPTVTEETEAEFAALARWCGGIKTVCAVDGYCIIVQGAVSELKVPQGFWIVKTHPKWFDVYSNRDFAATYEEAEG